MPAEVLVPTYPPYVDGVAHHIGGAFLALGSLGHGGIIQITSAEPQMKKPLNKFALGLWILAAMYVVAEIWAYLYFNYLGAELSKLGKPPQFPAFLDTPPTLVLAAAVLASLGVLIEIGDKIRWLLERRTG